ncbi:hypothetical protein SDC9_148048 [bioreactor metagenome]|uniref:Uncharacterized protein n=1 Tax=bioreactor metagenome TaxID=1076179 RepID=A0A645EHQ4_9ZZZZ
MTVMTLICRVNDFIIIVQHHTFDGGGTDVQSNTQEYIPPNNVREAQNVQHTPLRHC